MTPQFALTQVAEYQSVYLFKGQYDKTDLAMHTTKDSPHSCSFGSDGFISAY